MAETSRQSNSVGDNSLWEKNPHGFRIGASFSTLKAAIEFASQPDADDKDPLAAGNKQGIKEFIDALPASFTAPNYSDTSVGGNDAINALWQFNVDDDIIHPILSTDDDLNRCGRGLGRVYNEVYQNNMQMIWFRFGVPKFSKLSEFWLKGANPGVSRLMNEGPGASAYDIGRLFGAGIGLAFALPFLPITGAVKLMRSVEDMPITKYYALRPTMTLYYRMVTTILSQLAVNMGMYPNSDKMAIYEGGELNPDYKPDDKDSGPGIDDPNAIPEFLRKGGPDIFWIIDKRRRRVTKVPRSLDDLTEEMNKKPNQRSWLDVLGQIKDGIDEFSSVAKYAFGLVDYVGFRIEKGTDASESVNNTTGESSVASTINQKAAAGREKQFSSAGGNVGIPGLDQLIKGGKGVIEGLGAKLGAGAVTTIMTGNGYYDIPEVWKSSSFSKSYSFNIQLRAKYGDPVSIYQSIYVPLAMLLAAALPRGTGKNTYTSPFILEAYARGMFAIPLGIIESMTIKRGLNEHGWTHSHLPTAVDVTLNIKDLSPAFFVSLGGPELMDAFKANTTMEEYMATLSGLNIRERTYMSGRLGRRMKTFFKIKKDTIANPLYWANAGGESWPVRAIANCLPGWVPPET